MYPLQEQDSKMLCSPAASSIFSTASLTVVICDYLPSNVLSDNGDYAFS